MDWEHQFVYFLIIIFSLIVFWIILYLILHIFLLIIIILLMFRVVPECSMFLVLTTAHKSSGH